jgi:outer membrane immunogenic protein
MLRGIIISVTGAVMLATAANAADLYKSSPPPPAVSFKDTAPPYVAVTWSGLYGGVNGGGGWSAKTDFLSPTGGFGGGQIGYNFQYGSVVFGIEGDFDASDIADKNQGQKSSLNWFGSARGRLGYAFDRTLLYGTGGFGYGRVKNDGFAEIQTGWVAGGGVEYKFSPSWSGKVEYLYYDLDAPLSSPVGPLGGGAGDRTQFHTVRAGVNYFLSSVYEPLK